VDPSSVHSGEEAAVCGLLRLEGFGGSGQSLVEYVLILAFVTLVCVAALTVFGGVVARFYPPLAAAL
jgi:Flp pilus assembly pilin Flp